MNRYKLLLITDAWEPQVNGVVRTLQTTIKHLSLMDVHTDVIHPYLFKHISTKELAIPYDFSYFLNARLMQFDYDYVHVAVEGWLGIVARHLLNKHGIKYTTAYHTMFPEYINERYQIPTSIGYQYFKWFHKSSSCIMVPNEWLQQHLTQKKFPNVQLWSRGVDIEQFNPIHRTDAAPYALYVGRVSVEKNIESFLKTNIPLKKVVVGDGPALRNLKRDFPETEFVGIKRGVELSTYYANASVFVFPSRTDTFGLVNIEALASGTPVAGYNVPNMTSIVRDSVGCLDDDLSKAISVALTKDRNTCRQHVLDNFTWDVCTRQFRNNLVSFM